jgi:hypothetical protein
VSPSQRAGRTSELADQHARLQLREPLGVAVEHRKPDRGLVAEGHRQCLLQMCAARHRRVAIAAGEIGEDTTQRGDILLDDPEPRPHLEHDRGIHDVLCGRAPMQVTAGLAALPGDLVHQRQDRIADNVGLAAEQIEIQRRDVGLSSDVLRRLRWDHAAARLRLGQRDLDFGIARDQAEVGKHLAHPRRAESIAEQNGVENGGRGREGCHQSNSCKTLKSTRCSKRPGRPVLRQDPPSPMRAAATIRGATFTSGLENTGPR